MALCNGAVVLGLPGSRGEAQESAALACPHYYSRYTCHTDCALPAHVRIGPRERCQMLARIMLQESVHLGSSQSTYLAG